MSDRGFILEPTYRVEAGKPVVHLFGRLENGETFLVRDDRQTPHFYIRTADADRARELGVSKLQPTSRVSLAGEPVSRVPLPRP